VYRNDVAFWGNVPSRVWGYALGGNQVMKKWLSYREKALLGRGLTLEEMTEVTHMARRIAALLLLQPALDRNYHAVKTGHLSLARRGRWWQTIRNCTGCGRRYLTGSCSSGSQAFRRLRERRASITVIVSSDVVSGRVAPMNDDDG
jgi:hypothetical protein